MRLKLKLHRLGPPRLAMWVWAYNLKTKADCDAMIAWATGRITDLLVFAIDDSVTPRTWLGTGVLGTTDATLIDGKTPWAYVYDAAHAAGIRVHAWMWISTFTYIGGVNGVDPDIPNNATYNDGGVWNFHNATARTQLVAEMVDFIDNNNVDGINFNYESTTANILEQDLTDFLTELRAAIGSDLEISFCTGASVADDINLKMDVDGWVAAGLIDTVTTMGYFDCNGIKKVYTDTLPTLPASRLLIGVGDSSNDTAASDMAHKLKSLITVGYRNFAFFCWGDNFDGDASLRAVVDDYLANTLIVTQDPITKVAVTPGTSFTLTVGGAVQTTLYSSVTDHLYSGPLKRHIEAGLGSENPAVIYYRLNSQTTSILIGDFEP